MFGLGAIFTEVLDDVSLRIAPLREHDALATLKGIRRVSNPRPPSADGPRRPLALPRTLITLGRIGLENDSIEAIDFKPLLLQENGTPIAVDAAIWMRQ